jgi:hypothetical protein
MIINFDIFESNNTTLRLIRGVGRNIGSAVDLYGKGLYLTDSKEVANFYGNKILTFEIKGKIYDSTKDFTKNELKQICQTIDFTTGTRAGSDFLQDIINYNDGKIPTHTDVDYKSLLQALASNYKLYVSLKKRGGLTNDFNPDANFATVINKALSKLGYIGVKYSTSDIDDLEDNNLGNRNAYVIFNLDNVKPVENIEKLEEGLISTVPTKKTIKILGRKFPDYHISLVEGNIEISSGRKNYIDDIKDIDNICKQLGWFISHGNIPSESVYYKYNDPEFFDQKYEEIIIKPIFDPKDIPAKPNTLYHVVSKKNVDKIMKIGLIPKREDKLDYHPNKIYLIDELELAWGLKKEFERIDKIEYEILKISMKDLDIKLYADVDYPQHGFYTLENIPPKFISILPKEEYRKHWKGVQEKINEGYSNYKSLTQIARNKIDENWDRIIKRKGDTQFSFNFQLPDGKNSYVIIKFDSKSDGSYIENDFDINKGVPFYKIKISTNFGFSWNSEKQRNELEKSSIKDDIVGSIVHEITHLGQRSNGFKKHEFEIYYNKYKERKKSNPNLKYQDFYDQNHDIYKLEKEAVLIKFFELLRRNIQTAVHFCYNEYEYFDLYPYKKIINKMISYGVEIDTFYKFIDDLKKLLNEMTERSLKFIDDPSKYDMIKKCYILGKQFNIQMKNNIKQIYNTFKYDEPKSYWDYDEIDNEIKKIINDNDLN